MREVVQPRSRVAQGRRRAAPRAMRKQKAPPKRGFGTRGNRGVWEETSLLEDGTKPRRELHVHAFHSAHSAHSAVGMASVVLLLFDRGPRRVQSICDASFLCLHLDLARRTALDHRNAAGELRYALLQLFLVVVAGRFVDLGTDVLDPRLDPLGIAGPVDDGGFFLRDLDTFRAPEILEGRLFEGLSDFLGNDLAAR